MSRQTVALVMGTPGAADFISTDYALPAPYSPEDYAAALDDLRSRWDTGERGDSSGAYTKGYKEGAEMAAYFRGLNDGLHGGSHI